MRTLRFTASSYAYHTSLTVRCYRSSVKTDFTVNRQQSKENTPCFFLGITWENHYIIIMQYPFKDVLQHVDAEA